MKKTHFSARTLILAGLLAVSFVSCKKEDEDEGILPQISFITGASYTAKDTTVGKNITLKVGINAAKSEPNDVLTKFNESVSYDGGAATTLQNTTLTGTQGDVYTTDVNVVTRNQTGTEKYTFTVVNKDGLTNTISLTVTVQ